MRPHVATTLQTSTREPTGCSPLRHRGRQAWWSRSGSSCCRRSRTASMRISWSTCCWQSSIETTRCSRCARSCRPHFYIYTGCMPRTSDYADGSPTSLTSGLPEDLSDNLLVLATGGGFAKQGRRRTRLIEIERQAAPTSSASSARPKHQAGSAGADQSSPVGSSADLASVSGPTDAAARVSPPCSATAAARSGLEQSIRVPSSNQEPAEEDNGLF
jgi:hypothetical protein